MGKDNRQHIKPMKTSYPEYIKKSYTPQEKDTPRENWIGTSLASQEIQMASKDMSIWIISVIKQMQILYHSEKLLYSFQFGRR